jgi:Fur family transcriptional regulator, peroxide stress response regulator
MPSLSLSTVYRILESLEIEGLIRRVSAGSGVARYDGTIKPHQHLVCRHCGCISDHEDEQLSRLRLPTDDLSGFVAEELDIRIVGTCPECRRPTVGAGVIVKRG